MNTMIPMMKQTDREIHPAESKLRRSTSETLTFTAVGSLISVMDAKEFRVKGKEMVDYMTDYLENVGEEHPVFPDVKPGYLARHLPTHAPENGEMWEDVFADVKKFIVPGMVHWQSPHFHAWYLNPISYPSLLGEMLSSAFNGLGFCWGSNPAATELEIIVLDWLGKMLQLPKQFLSRRSSGKLGKGGGVIQNSASEATLTAMIAARETMITKLRNGNDLESESTGSLCSSLVAYASVQAHLSVEKAAKIAAVKIRFLDCDEKGELPEETVRLAIEEDTKAGLVPFFLLATLGTTNTCAFDNLEELGPICEQHDIWMHVDAAYAGTAFICPEFRHLLNGVEYAQSFDFNVHKWMLVNFDCSAMWVRDKRALEEAFTGSRIYYKDDEGETATDFRNWGIPMSRRFRALKLWFVLRCFGVKGLQSYVRTQANLAKMFEKLVKADSRFEVITPALMPVVIFRMKGPNELQRRLVDDLNQSGKIGITLGELHGNEVIRFVIGNSKTEEKHITYAWNAIREIASRYVIPKDESAELVIVKARL